MARNTGLARLPIDADEIGAKLKPGLSTFHPRVRYGTSHPAEPLVLFGLTVVSLAAVVWGLSIISGRMQFQVEEYVLLLGFYGLASAWFVIPQVKASSARLFDPPVFITLFAFLRFGLIPLYFFFHPELRAHAYLKDPELFTQSLLLVVVGMMAFWVGSAHGLRPAKMTENTESETGQLPRAVADNRALVWAGGLYLVAIATKLYLLRHHLYSFTQSTELFFQNLAWMQVLLVMSQFGTCALVIAAVETYGHPHDRKRKILFYALFASECFWGLISGMKGFLLQNFVLAGLVSSLVQRRLRLKWLVTPLVLVVLIYPFNNQYRQVIRSEQVEITSMGDAAQSVGLAASRSLTQLPSMSDWLGSGSEATLSRLDMLQSVAAVVHYGPVLDSIRTRGHWWMLPFYPFIPRLLWPSKPQENLGQEFAVKQHENPNSCASISYLGDAYLEFGVVGLIACMVALGAFSAWLRRLVSCPLSKRRLFVFGCFFMIATDFEGDVFGYWTSVIRWLLILAVGSWLVYPRDSAQYVLPTPDSKPSSWSSLRPRSTYRGENLNGE